MATDVAQKVEQKESLLFDLSKLQNQPDLPSQFMWSQEELPSGNSQELDAPVVDLGVFLRGDEQAILEAAELVRTACQKHGFFQVINHGVDESLVEAAKKELDAIFKLPLDKKLSIPRKAGSVAGYSGSHSHRFSSKLPWKEAFSFIYHENTSDPVVVDYFKSVLGPDFERIGLLYQKYGEEMKKLTGVLCELLAISLGLKDRLHFKKFFEDGYAIVRCNYYPTCINPGMVLGTGPHFDPTSITILNQDEVGGLEVFVDGKWQAIAPRKGVLVINLGDTFMALTNGNYKSCMHRALVNNSLVRKSLAYFVNPKEEAAVTPPQDLVDRDGSRKYPDFTWLELLEFTQKHYRADCDTLGRFVTWLQSSKTSV